jgi:hypothetical protein
VTANFNPAFDVLHGRTHVENGKHVLARESLLLEFAADDSLFDEFMAAVAPAFVEGSSAVLSEAQAFVQERLGLEIPWFPWELTRLATNYGEVRSFSLEEGHQWFWGRRPDELMRPDGLLKDECGKTPATSLSNG